MKGPTEKLPVKCRKIDKKTKVITDEVMHKRYDKYMKRNQRKNLHPQSYRKIEYECQLALPIAAMMSLKIKMKMK